MERDLSQSTALCRSGCGFYGNPVTDGLCSKCFKDTVKRKQAAPQSTTSFISSSSPPLDPSPSLPSSSCNSTASLPIASPASIDTASPTVPYSSVSLNSPTASNLLEASGAKDAIEPCTSGGAEAVANVEIEKEGKTETKKKSNRCGQCRVKIGVLGFPCRCGGQFCSTHRYANEHACSFDYKSHGQEEIKGSLPVVVAKKIDKI